MLLKIFGDNWKFRVVSDEVFDKKHDRSAEAITYIHSKQIVLRMSEVTKAAIKHEISHAIHSYMIHTELELNQDQQEEFLCEFVAKYGDYIGQLTNTAYRRLTCLK